MAKYFLAPQSPLKKIDETTGDINYIYPLTTDKQVIMENGERLNTILNESILYLGDSDADDSTIKTTFSDKEKTTIVNPRTKISAVSDNSGVGLDVLLEDINTSVNAAQSTADSAMPKSGGTFTDDVIAYSVNRATSGLRNIEIRTTSVTGDLQSTNKIIMVRK